jgi:glyoxylase-like metal-dependent hydrolase (beta-lactamase superfamily II)/predicted small secreted protein
MKKLTILSIVTASFLMTACANETTHAENDIRIIKPANEATTSKIEMKIGSIGEDKTIGDIIKTAVESKGGAKEVTTTLSPEALEKIKASIKAELLKDFKSELEAESSNEQKLMANLKKEIKAELLVELKKELSKPTEKESTEKKSVESKVVAKTEVKKEASADAPFDYKLKPKKVADNVWCFLGALDKPTKENAGFMANSCYVKTSDGYFLMDSGPSYQFAKQAYAVMQKIADLPVKYVVNSHHHDDHWLGNDFYKQEFNATLIGPESINANYKEGDKTRMFKVLSENAIRGTHIIKLDTVPKKNMTITLGGEEFNIIPMDVKAHTADDVFVYMPKSKVLFGGDLVMNGRVNSDRDGAIMGELKAIKMMRGMEWNTLVPGHGLITDKTALDETEQYFTLMKERVLKAMEDGADATDITEKVTLPEFKDKAMYDLLNARNVGYAYDELEMLEDE